MKANLTQVLTLVLVTLLGASAQALDPALPTCESYVSTRDIVCHYDIAENITASYNLAVKLKFAKEQDGFNCSENYKQSSLDGKLSISVFAPKQDATSLPETVLAKDVIISAADYSVKYTDEAEIYADVKLKKLGITLKNCSVAIPTPGISVGN